jgi:hypothetical protein
MAEVQVISIFAFIVLIAFPSSRSLPIADEIKIDVNGRSPLEYGDKFQGDIVLTSSQQEMISRTGKGARTGLIDLAKRWPKDYYGQVIVPYTFNASDGFSKIKAFIHFDMF